MKHFLLAAFLVTVSMPVMAQNMSQPVSPPVSPPMSNESNSVAVNWQNLMNSVQILMKSDAAKLSTIVKMEKDAADLAAYWKSFVEGLPKK